MHSFVTRFPRLLCYACASPRLYTRGTCGTLTCVDGAPCDYPICRVVAAPTICFCLICTTGNLKLFNLSNWRNENLHTECTACKLTLCFVLCSQTLRLHSLVHIHYFILPMFWLSGGWVGLFARFAPCVVLFTHPPTSAQNNTRYPFLLGHTPSPNWLGSRISPKLDEKKDDSARSGISCVLMSCFFAVMFPMFVRHVRTSHVRFNFCFGIICASNMRDI